MDELKKTEEIKAIEKELLSGKREGASTAALDTRYNQTHIGGLKAKIQLEIKFIEELVGRLQSDRAKSDEGIRKQEGHLQKLREEYTEVVEAHRNAQELKRAPKERSMSKIPINNQRSSLITD